MTSSSQLPPTPSDETLGEVSRQLTSATPRIVVEAIATQLELAREARRRVSAEGVVVRDMRGVVLDHPAIQTETKALAEVERMTHRWKKDGLEAVVEMNEDQDD